MSNLQEIETKIKQLPSHEIHQLAEWLNNYIDDLWDQQMEIDLATGKLDQIIAKAETDILENNMQEIDEILCN
jgi:UTP:GlnB (protein PII) uridylyltransferase